MFFIIGVQQNIRRFREDKKNNNKKDVVGDLFTLE
jgi:hypothetical protein